MNYIGALLGASASTCTVPPSEVTAEAALPYAAFDSRDGPFGWRTLVAAGSTDSAVSLSVHYSEANLSTLASAQRREGAFHIGQALAMANRPEEAIGPLEQALDPEAPPEWATYVKATLAFLRRDTVALHAVHSAYQNSCARLPRLRIIEGFIACPAEPYMQAAH